MSGAPVPSPIPPQPSRPRPQIAPAPKPRPSRRWRAWAVFSILLIAGALWYQLASRVPAEGGPPADLGIRTATVATGTFERTIRLTGATAAEQFVMLVAPQLRGSRSGMMIMSGGAGRIMASGGGGSSRSGGSSSTSSGGGSSGSDGGRSSSSSSSSGASTGSGSTGTSAPIVGSLSGGGGGSIGGGSGSSLRGSSNRFSGSSGRSSAPRSSGGGASSAAQGSAVMGSDGLGSTAGQLVGGGGGGGGGGSPGGGRGGSEWSLVLQELVKPGSMVKKGDVVAGFDRENMLTRLDDYRASVAQTEVAFEKLKADLEVTRKAQEHQISMAKAQVEKARLDLKTLPVRGAIDAEKLKLDLEEAEAQYKELLAQARDQRIIEQTQLRVQEIELQQSRLELKRAEANTDKMIVRAPIDGLTVMQSIRRGAEFAQIQQGDQLFPGMPFMQIVNPGSMVVNALVNQADVEQMRMGQRARVRFDAYPGLELPAHVVSIGAIPKPGGMRAAFVKEIPVRLKFDQSDPRVIPDLSVSVDVQLETMESATIAPLGGIFHDDKGKPYVMVRNGKGWEKRPVELGPVNYLVAAIRSGLRPGEVVAAEWPVEKVEQGQSRL